MYRNFWISIALNLELIYALILQSSFTCLCACHYPFVYVHSCVIIVHNECDTLGFLFKLADCGTRQLVPSMMNAQIIPKYNF